jgi:DGQHR domain-containing protein
MKIKGYTVKQGKDTYYVGIMKVKDLINRGRVDTFSTVHNEGYQRSLSMARARAFGRYILSNNSSPLSILLNIRDEPVKENPEGTLRFPEGVQMWVVDGQHRLEGLRFATEQDPSVGESDYPVVIMNQSSGYEEAWQFITINKTQKGVRTDLAERFLNQALKREGRKTLLELRDSGVLKGVLKNVEWVGKALEITDILNGTKTHPWYMKIRLPNEPKSGTIVAQKSFTDSIEPILKDSFFQGKDANAIASALINYWDAIWELCEEAFMDPRDHVIQKTTGVFVLHKIFPRISELCRDNYGNRVLTKEKIKSVIETLPMMSSEYWSSSGEAGKKGTSRKAFASIVMEILEFLELSQKDRQPDLVT